jgi:hypothetical protein
VIDDRVRNRGRHRHTLIPGNKGKTSPWVLNLATLEFSRELEKPKTTSI